MSAQANHKLRDRLIGTWKLVSALRAEIPSGEKTPFLGENPTGFLHYMPDGRMLAMITRAGRKSPAGNAATAAEAQAFKQACACFGLGRYLYYFTGTWVDLDDHKRPKSVPQLAGWATPGG